MRDSTAAFGLVLVQAPLGGLTVEKGLKEELVATHLGVAMLQIGLILLVARLSRRPPDRSHAGRTRPGDHARASGALGDGNRLVLATIVAGGYMAASELEGTGREQRRPTRTWHAATDFPLATEASCPFGTSRAIDIHLTHRALMYLASTAVLALFAPRAGAARGG